MEFSNELIQKAKTARNVPELMALAKAEGIEMTEEESKAHVELRIDL